jgi:DNA-binding NarL/FixJ family response regulator
MTNTRHRDANKVIKISIIEDSEIHREWLKAELSCEYINIVSADRFGRDGVESVKRHKPNLVLVDFQLEDMTGLEVSKRIKKYDENVKVFSLTAHTETSIIERIISDKNIDAIAIKGSYFFENNFLSAISYVSDGGMYLDPMLLRNFRESNELNGLNKLTKREFEIFVQTNSGKSDEKISEDLNVELSHVRNLKSKIIKKTRNNNVYELVDRLVENNHPDSFSVEKNDSEMK